MGVSGSRPEYLTEQESTAVIQFLIAYHFPSGFRCPRVHETEKCDIHSMQYQKCRQDSIAKKAAQSLDYR